MKKNTNNKQTIEIDNAKIYFDIIGNEAAEPLVLLHGGLGSIEDFDSLIPLLSPHFKLIRIDNRGHGRSTLGNCGLTYKRLEEDTIEILRHLNIKVTSILGFSDGGIVDYRLMASSSVKITKLVTIGSDFQLKANDPIRDIYARITGQSWTEKFPDSYHLYQQLNPKPNFDNLVTAVKTMWLDTSSYPSNSINKLDGDVLIIRGDNDPFFSGSAALELTNRIKDSKFANIPFAGHEAHKDQPEIIFNLISTFFNLFLYSAQQ